jgi:hypothetical protein
MKNAVVIEFCTGDRFEFHYNLLLNHPTVHQMWGKCTKLRLRPISKQMNRCSLPRLAAITSVYLDETYGDSSYYTHIIHEYKNRMDASKLSKQAIDSKSNQPSFRSLWKSINLPNSDKNFTEFRNYVDTEVKATVQNLYGTFSEFTKPLIPQSLLRNMENKFKELLPHQYSCIQVILGRYARSSESKSKQNEEHWDQFAFYLFCYMMRIRNDNNFVWLSICNAASHYGCGRNHIGQHFGMSCSPSTLLRKLSELFTFDEIMMKSRETLEKFKDFLIAVFDNSQVNLPIKFQSNGKSSNMAEATTRAFIEPTKPLYIDEVPNQLLPVEMTYYKQKIPSPYGMPKYEQYGEFNSQSFDDPALRTFESSIDLTGKRVEAYVTFRRRLSMTRRLKMIVPWGSTGSFLHQIPEHAAAIRRLHLPNRLRANSDKHAAKSLNECTWYHSLLKHHHEHPTIWRGTPQPVKFLLPPVSPENETTNRGAANVVMSLLLLQGIIVPTDSEGARGDIRKMKLAEDYKSRFVMLVGDGLSQVRVRTFEELVKDSSFWFDEQQQCAQMLHKAMGQVINVTGDLHGGRFHFLSAIYNLFYGSLIQFVQILLKWKRIKGSDVTKCYQQAAGLGLMIVDELDRQLFAAYIAEVEGNDETHSSPMATEEDPKELATIIAGGYREWLEQKQKSTTDEVFKMGLNLSLLMDMYRDFRVSLNTGDAIMIEQLYNDYLPAFFVTKKSTMSKSSCP